MKTLSDYRRIVIKIGSALLVDRDSGRLRDAWLAALADDIEGLVRQGAQVLIVSSGAIALGRTVMQMPNRALRLDESQAAAAIGQIELGRAYSEILGRRDIKVGQVLLTLGDTEERRRYLNARSTIKTMLELGAVPIVNENDTVATSEIRYGDNDRLAARVATMMEADCLILLSDIDGMYTAPPNDNPDAEFIPVIDRITPEIEAMAGAAGSELSRGGMKTKVDAGKIATSAGTSMVIASGKRYHPVKAIQEGARCTWFIAHETPVNARKAWISGHIEKHGTITIDDGASRALKSGKSLLPAGIRKVEGAFSRGDAIGINDLNGQEIGLGLAAYDHDDARRIAGRNSREIEEILGYAGRAEMIHRDDLVLREM
ncbi:glutamate 5-kinase [Coralliovum pocilloporae]|uniref:glutamate 5-kinase n=1 Tax=Coralliovum pocilloporae TaxID=3066369 RepID=UPI0033074886